MLTRTFVGARNQTIKIATELSNQIRGLTMLKTGELFYHAARATA